MKIYLVFAFLNYEKNKDLYILGGIKIANTHNIIRQDSKCCVCRDSSFSHQPSVVLIAFPFTDEETEACAYISKWWKWDSNPDSTAPAPEFLAFITRERKMRNCAASIYKMSKWNSTDNISFVLAFDPEAPGLAHSMHLEENEVTLEKLEQGTNEKPSRYHKGCSF